MFQGINNGSELIKESVKAIYKYPRMFIPLLICWIIYAPILVIFKFHIPWHSYGYPIQAVIVFSAILLLSIIFSWSSFVLLELIRQIEMGQKANLFLAIGKSLVNLLIALPIALAWAVIWFFLALLEAIFSRKSEDDETVDYNAENVAKTVAGFEEFSLSGAFFDALKKGVRMAAFLIYPAIAWEKMGTSNSIKKGLNIAKAHKTEFATGFVLTELAAGIVFLPPGILFYISSKFDVTFPEMVWFGTMIYCAFAWSFSLFLEQMFVAELYLWHLIWEKEVEKSVAQGLPEPKLEDVKRPCIVDNVSDLLLTNVPRTVVTTGDQNN